MLKTIQTGFFVTALASLSLAPIQAVIAKDGKQTVRHPLEKSKVVAQSKLTIQLQSAIDTYLKERSEPEHISGLALTVSLPNNGGMINLYTGYTNREPATTPISDNSLFQIGSITKSFTAALILDLEADRILNIHQTIGDWLPQYPAWQTVTIKQLLNMTSDIPTYSEVPTWSKAEAADIQRQWTPQELVDMVYPTNPDAPPPTTGYFYSNTNYILAGMIVEAATGNSYQSELERRILSQNDGLEDTFYAPSIYSKSVLNRLVAGYFYNTDRDQRHLAPLVGQNLKTNNMSWARAAGGMVSNPKDVTNWVRALFGGKVIPKTQLAQMMSVVSQKTGEAIPETTSNDPRGFGLGIVQAYQSGLGNFWFYQGETLGYRMIYSWFPTTDVVITIGANSQPSGAENRIGSLMQQLYDIVDSSFLTDRSSTHF